MASGKLNFNQAYQELEKIVNDFETRELDLEKDIPQFEKGMKLAQQLKKQLQSMENKVVEIEQKFQDN
jgi:exodeoxyribonuclease VII small subunit